MLRYIDWSVDIDVTFIGCNDIHYEKFILKIDLYEIKNVENFIFIIFKIKCHWQVFVINFKNLSGFFNFIAKFNIKQLKSYKNYILNKFVSKWF